MRLIGANIRDVDPMIVEMGLWTSSGSPQHMVYQYPGSLVGTDERVTLRLHLDREIVTRSYGVVETRTENPFQPIISETEIETLEDALEFATTKGRPVQGMVP